MKKILSLLAMISIFAALPGLVFANQSIALDPVGTNIVDSGGTVYMISIENGQKVRRPYTSAGAFLSYGFNSFNKVNQYSDGFSYPIGSFIPPQDGKIICSDRGSDKGTCYLATGSQKAGFVSEPVFKGLGYSFANALLGDVSFLPSSANIESASEFHRQGTIVNLNNVIYYVQQNPFTNGHASLEGFKDSAAFDSWGYSLSSAVPANAADKALNILTEEVQTRGLGGLVPPRPADFPPPVSSGNPVQITNFNPPSGPVGSQVTITGSGFASTGNTVTFGQGDNNGGSTLSNISSPNGTTLQFIVPSSPTFSCPPSTANLVVNCDPIALYRAGSYNVTVTNANGVSNGKIFTVTSVVCLVPIDCPAPLTGYYYQPSADICSCGVLTPLSPAN